MQEVGVQGLSSVVPSCCCFAAAAAQLVVIAPRGDCLIGSCWVAHCLWVSIDGTLAGFISGAARGAFAPLKVGLPPPPPLGFLT